MTVYWSSTKAPAHLFKRSYETPELAALMRENACVDPAILAADLRIESFHPDAVRAYQRRLGVRKINNPRAGMTSALRGQGENS